MEENRSYLINYAMSAGIILGVFWILKYIFVIIVGDNFLLNLIANMLAFGTPILLFIFLAKYNSELVNNRMSYWHGVQFSILLFFFASIPESLIVLIHVKWIDPGFISNLYSNLIEIAQSLNISETLTTQLSEQPPPTTFYYIFSNVIMADVFLGLLLSLFIVPMARHFKPTREQ